MLKQKLLFPTILLCSSLVISESNESSIEIFIDHFEDNNLVETEAAGFAWKQQWSETVSTTWDHSFDATSGATRTLGKNLHGESGATFDTPDYPDEAPEYLNKIEEIWYKINGATGATTDEVRMADGIRIDYSNQGRVAGLGLNTSQERDYSSYSFNTNLSWDFFQRNFTVGLAHAQFFEDFHPMAPFIVQNNGEKRISNTVLSLAQSLTTQSLVSGTIGLTNSWGYLGHPYTPITTVSGELLPENLPSTKTSLAVAPQFIQGFYIADQLATIRLKYRYYTDSWGLVGNTSEIQASSYLTEWLTTRLRFRYHTQAGNSFTSESFTGQEIYRTADIRFYSFDSYLIGIQFTGLFPESWESVWLPKEWQTKWDHLWRTSKGNLKLYQLYAEDENYSQDEFMASIKYLF